MTVPFIVPFYTGIFVILFLALAVRVSRVRRAAGVSVGTGGNATLERAVRAHGNFAEFVPLALLLLGFLEMQRTSAATLHVLCLLLLIGRIAHAIGISREPEVLPLRAGGVALTYLVLIVAAVTAIYDYRLAETLPR